MFETCLGAGDRQGANGTAEGLPPTGSQLEGRATPEASQTTGCAGVVCPLMKVKSGVALFICWVNNFEDFLSKTSFGGVAQVWTLSVFSEESCVSL